MITPAGNLYENEGPAHTSRAGKGTTALDSPKATVMLLTALLLAGCARHAPYELSDADKHRFAAVARVPAAASEGSPLIFGVHDCTLYKAVTEHQDIVDWRVVLRSDWGGAYMKFMTSCTGEDVRYDGKFVRVFMCAQAIGAGGGCADGGNYRSRDSEHHWEISRDPGHWHALPH